MNEVLIEIPVSLEHHCIETAAKKVYEKSIRQYFKAGETKKAALENRIEGLKTFLETYDFSDLRARCSAMGEKEAVIVISWPDKATHIRFKHGILSLP